MHDLSDLAILVTGASSGIGLATAELLAERGARVTAIALDDARLDAARERLGDRVSFVAADVSDSHQVEAAFEVAEKVAPLTGVFHAAGISRVAPAAETSDETWALLMSVNLTGTFHVSRSAARRLRDGSSLVLIGSELALVGQPGYAAYSATKGAVLAMSRTLAAELAPRGIRVNTLSPGTTDTPLLAAEFASPAERERDEASVPLRRFAQPHEIAEGAAWLLSGAAAYVTGTNLVIDGGRTATLSSTIAPHPAP